MRLDNYFYIKRLTITIIFTGIAILLTHIPQELTPSQLQESGLDKIVHILAYGTITFLLVFSLKNLLSLRSAFLIMFTLSVIGAIDELTQSLVSRQTSFSDLLADVAGIVIVLLFSFTCRHPLQHIKTGPASRLYLTAMVSFIAGALIVPVASMTMSALKRPSLFQQQQAVLYFFYSTMREFFENNYNSKNRTVSETAIETIEEWGSRFGDKCWLNFFQDPYNLHRQRSGYFVGVVHFPSGDMFEVTILPMDNRFVIEKFKPWDWDSLWEETRRDTERYYRLGHSPAYYEP